VFVNFFALSHIRYNKLASELSGFRILVRKMSALKVKIDNRTGGSQATLLKLTAYVTYGLVLALSYIYIMRISVFLCQ